jgi:hypothetical protein
VQDVLDEKKAFTLLTDTQPVVHTRGAVTKASRSR